MLFVSVRLIRLPEEKKVRNILGRIKSTGEKNIPRKRKSKKDKKAECKRGAMLLLKEAGLNTVQSS